MELYRFAAISGDFPKTGIAVPLGNRKLLRSVFSQLKLHKGGSFINRLKISIIRFFISEKTIGIFAKKFFTVAANPSSQNLFSHIGNNLGEKDFVCAFYTSSRKFVFPIFRASDGFILGYGKLYFEGKESSDYGENEANILEKMNGLQWSEMKPPKIIHKGYFGKNFLEIISSEEGIRSFHSVTGRHFDWIRELSKKTGKRVVFENSRFFAEMEKNIEVFKLNMPLDHKMLEDFWIAAKKRFQGREFTFGISMREFSYWEMLPYKKGFLIIDWEHAREEYPAVFDVFSLLTGLDRNGGDNAYGQLMRRIFFSKNLQAMNFIVDSLPWLGVEKEDLYYFFIFFLMDQLYIGLDIGDKNAVKKVWSFLKTILAENDGFRKKWLGGNF
jgi:hypothetical protein